MDKSEAFGRLCSVKKIFLHQMNLDEGNIIPAIQVETADVICYRCGQKTTKKRAALPNNQYFCPQCIIMGRISTLDILYTIPEPNNFIVTPQPLTWKGKLSPAQLKCSQKLKKVIQQRRDHLLWAVTGAGKTEMLFEALAYAIQKKLRVCLATPRIDVCNELFPRLQMAFKNVDILLLHGGQQQRYRYTQLIVCTTHQLLNFRGAFDVLVIDEADAFPFVNNKLLQHAVENARKKISSLILLTATPTRKLLKETKKGKMTFSYLPLRYHGNSLPLPKTRITYGWEAKLKNKKLPYQMKKIIEKWVRENFPFLIFVPKISLLNLTYEAVKKILNSNIHGAAVHAADPERLEKVAKLREGKLRFLVTTTILERGVTFPNLNVLVLGAEERIFNKAALVQIAGRVGRSAQRPDGDVFFLCQTTTRQITGAVKQITFLNRRGRQLQKWKNV
ncbi:ComF operon protein 1 [Liquorilactobacillus sucicola DSM 21376 = JCM 15457]|uniref:ComF operon protein 1 n=1 Tax=Liquorilactobacillus sucicola DSM 21376 = JCM 15457 TaxID=1423806 RepID=A0A0R2DY32_9LACO|nr:DEAD/DEAH box helicase [Liquorilactobacillus sucicola]KRN05959.1 ComF operon protein 1 [Liquorilactobacillus sucicola DSM 21376 = JCM 15457]